MKENHKILEKIRDNYNSLRDIYKRPFPGRRERPSRGASARRTGKRIINNKSNVAHDLQELPTEKLCPSKEPTMWKKIKNTVRTFTQSNKVVPEQIPTQPEELKEHNEPEEPKPTRFQQMKQTLYIQSLVKTLQR